MGKIIEAIGEEWWDLLKDEFNKPYMKVLSANLIEERKKYNIYPESRDIFNAYKLVKPDDVKVILLGQD